jgi:streptogramin lyase
MKAKLKFISAQCSLILFILLAVFPQSILAQTNYYWSSPVRALTGGGQPAGVAIDTAGNIFVADYNNNVILKAAPSGTSWIVTTNWTATTIAGSTGNSGTTNGTGSAARFNQPYGVAVDSTDNIYVADSGNNCIRKITPSGANWIVTTIAGVADPDLTGTTNGINGAAQFSFPVGITIDAAGNLFIGDNGNDTIRKITHSGTNWITSTIAGSAATAGSYADGTNGDAGFSDVLGVVVDAADNVYVADGQNYVIRKVTPSGANWITTTIAGQVGNPGANDGTNFDAQFGLPYAMSVDNAGNVYVTDAGNNTIRRLTPSGTNWIVTTIGGLAGGTSGPPLVNGTNDAAVFSSPLGVAADSAGNIYVADTGDDALRLGLIFPPLLQMTLATNQATLFYPAFLGTNMNFNVQSATNLSNNSWGFLTNKWKLATGGMPYVNLAVTNKVPDNFFRLHLP